MSDTIQIFVPGRPAPAGSKRGVIHKATGKVVMIDMSKGKDDWMAKVATAASEAIARVMRGPVSLTVTFVMPRPKYHYHTGKRAGELRSDAPKWHTSAPDATKLMRGTEDALKAIAWADDSQVAEQKAYKIYGDKPGAHIEIAALEAT